MSQQAETLDYFRAFAADWQRKAVNAEDQYNLIESRNAAVLATMEAMPAYRSLLDVGCGTGQLVIEAARRGIAAHGIDFSPEMIAQCLANQQSASVSASFAAQSLFDFDVVPDSFDVISAQGFIEYISPRETLDFYGRALRMLKPGGALVVGSRNRLYNVTSLNAFTTLEERLDTLPGLTREAIILQSSVSQKAAIADLARLMRAYPQPDNHPDTGIGVAVRYQYSPAEMIDQLQRIGFKVETIYPIHFHGLPPTVKDQHPAVHHSLAKTMQEVARFDQRIVPFCSSFVIDARKAV